jgi:hypothetical protein
MSKIKTISILLSILMAMLLPIFDTNADVSIKSIDLIWTTDTYTPYGYQGRALPTEGSQVTIEALVETSGGKASSLKYSWFLDDVFQQGKSGYGKTSYYFYVNQKPGNFHKVKLQIFNEDRSVFQEKTIEIPIVSPEIVIYPSSGNSHFSDQASQVSTVLAGKEFSFIAKPYFFSIQRLTDLTFQWRFAGQEPIVSSEYDANVLDMTISGKEDKGTLEKDLWVDVTNKTETRQNATQSIKVQIY